MSNYNKIFNKLNNEINEMKKSSNKTTNTTNTTTTNNTTGKITTQIDRLMQDLPAIKTNTTTNDTTNKLTRDEARLNAINEIESKRQATTPAVTPTTTEVAPASTFNNVDLSGKTVTLPNGKTVTLGENTTQTIQAKDENQDYEKAKHLGVTDTILSNLKKGWLNNKISKLYYDEMNAENNQLSEKDSKKLEKYETEMQKLQDKLDNTLVNDEYHYQGSLGDTLNNISLDLMPKVIKDIGNGSIAGASEQIGQMAEMQLNGGAIARDIAGTGVGAGTGFVAGNATGIGALLPEEVLTVPGGALYGLKKSMELNGIIGTMEVEAGSAYQEMVQAGVDKSIAQKIALAVGGINAGIESLQLDEILDGYKVLAKSGSKSALKEVLGQYISNMGKEIGQEVLQESVTFGGSNLGKKLSGLETDSLADYGSRVADTAKATALSMGLLGIPGAVSTYNKTNNEIKNNNQLVANELASEETKQSLAKGEKLLEKVQLGIPMTPEETLELQDYNNQKARLDQVLNTTNTYQNVATGNTVLNNVTNQLEQEQANNSLLNQPQGTMLGNYLTQQLNQNNNQNNENKARLENNTSKSINSNQNGLKTDLNASNDALNVTDSSNMSETVLSQLENAKNIKQNNKNSLKKIADKIGINTKLVSDVKTDNGASTLAYYDYNKSEAGIEDNEKAIMNAMHEYTHGLQHKHKENYNAVKKSFYDLIVNDEETRTLLRDATGNLYNEKGGQNLNADRLSDEEVAQGCAVILGNEETCERLAKSNPSALQKIIEFFEDFINYIKSKFNDKPISLKIYGVDIKTTEGNIKKFKRTYEKELNKASNETNATTDENDRRYLMDYDDGFFAQDENLKTRPKTNLKDIRYSLKEDSSSKEVEDYADSLITDDLTNYVRKELKSATSEFQNLDVKDIDSIVDNAIDKYAPQLKELDEDLSDMYYGEISNYIYDKTAGKILPDELHYESKGDWYEPDTKYFENSDTIYNTYNKFADTDFARNQFTKINDKIDDAIDLISKEMNLPENISILSDTSKVSEANYITISDENTDEQYKIRVGNHFENGTSGDADVHIKISDFTSISKLIDKVKEEIKDGLINFDIETDGKMKKQKLADEMHYKKLLREQEQKNKTTLSNVMAEAKAKEKSDKEFYKELAKVMTSNQKLIDDMHYTKLNRENITQVKNSYQEQIKMLKQKVNNDIANMKELHKVETLVQKNTLKEDYQSKLEDRLAKQKEKDATKLSQTINKMKENQRVKDYKEDWNVAIKREKDAIYKTIKEFDRNILNPKEKSGRYLPENFVKPVAEIINMLETSKNDKATNINAQLTEVKNMLERKIDYESLNEVDYKELGLVVDFDEDVKNDIVDMIDSLGGKKVEYYTPAELVTLNNILKGIEHQAKNANKVFYEGKQQKVDDIVTNSIMPKIELTKKKYTTVDVKEIAKDTFVTKALRPMHLMNRLGMKDYFQNEMLEGQDKQISIAREFKQQYDSKLESHKGLAKKMSNSKRFEFILESGNSLELNKQELMELYLLYKDSDAKRHILEGGIVPADLKTHGTTKTQEIQRVTAEDVHSMFERLTPDEMQFADELGDFINSRGKEISREAFIGYFGYDKNKMDYYHPINVSGVTLNTNFDQQGNAVKGSVMSLAHDRKNGASNALIIGNITDVYYKYANDVATFNGYGDVIRTLTKIYNYKDENVNFKNEVNKRFGKKTNEVFKKLILDLQQVNLNANIDNDTPANKLASISLASKIAFNISSAMKQPIAFVKTLNAGLSPKYMLPAMAIKATDIATRDTINKEMQQYAPIAYLKSLGYSESNQSRGLSQSSLEVGSKGRKLANKVKDISYSGMEMADMYTWGAIWYACKSEYADKHGTNVKNLKDADLKEVNKRFREIIADSQVVDTILHKGETIKHGGSLEKIETAYMNEPSSLVSMVADGYLEMQRTGNKKPLVTAITCMTLNTLLEGTISDFVYKLRHPDDDDEEKETIVDKIKDFAGSMLGNLYYVNHIKSLIDGYTNEDIVWTPIEDIINDIQSLEKIYDGSDIKKTKAKVYKDLMFKIANFTGINIENFERDFIELPLNLYDEMTGDYTGTYKRLKASENIANSSAKTDYYDLLYKVKQKDVKQYNTMLADVVNELKKSSDKTDDQLKKQVENAVKRRDDKEE